MSISKRNIIYILSFFVINILFSFFLCSNVFLKNLSPYPNNFFMLTNRLVGEFGFLLILFGLSVLLIKTDYSRARFLMIVSIVIAIIYFGLSVFFQQYGMFFSFYNLAGFASDGGQDSLKFLIDALASLFESAQFLFLASGIIMVILFILIYVSKKKMIGFRESSIIEGINRIYIGLGVTTVGILLMINSFGAYKVNIDDSWYEDNTTPLYGTQAVGLFNYYIYDGYNYFFTKRLGYDPDAKTKIQEELNKYKEKMRKNSIDNVEYGNSKYEGIFKDKNLLLIQMESFSNYLIGLEVLVNGEYKELTPNLNRIINSNSSTYFNNYYTNVGIGNTSDAEFTTMTGLYPVGNDITIYQYNQVDYETLPKLFKKEGYSSFSAHANTGSFYERVKVHPGLYGFDYHIGEEDLIIKDEGMLHTWLNDEDFLTQTIELMEKESKNGPVFSFAITISNHMPYEKPVDNEYIENENWFIGKDNFFPTNYTVVSDKIVNKHMINYFEHVSYADYAIGKALEKIEESSLKDDTIIVLYGDHGGNSRASEILYRKDLIKNEINTIPTLEDLNEVLTRRKLESNIPFIIYDPSGNEYPLPNRIELVRGQNSTSRTIASLFDLDPNYYFGVDALSDEPSFTYNPKNLDIFLDGLTISGQSLIYQVSEKYLEFYTDKMIIALVDEFLKSKDLNDKFLKSEIFPKINPS